MTHHGMTSLPGAESYCSSQHRQHRMQPGRFGRLFSELPPNYVKSDLLAALGAAGGPMDGGTKSDPANAVAVGHVIFGQFIDHDITLDVTSSLDHNSDPLATANARTPTLDLDCIYGEGPEVEPFMYRADGARLLTGADDDAPSPLQREDLLRAPNGRAIIGDPRNDENRIVSQMQLAMIRFHNHNCDDLHALDSRLVGRELFDAARERTTWHYQWTVVHDFLVAMCGQPVVNDVLANGRQFYCPDGEPFIPVEFAVAAYRFGHSMVPQHIQVQKNGRKHPFFGDTLGAGFSAVSDPGAVVDWNELFDTSAQRRVQRAERLDAKLATSLLKLPFCETT